MAEDEGSDAVVALTEATAGSPEPLSKFTCCPVVAVGASAGGLDAFIQLLKHLAPGTGFAFIIIQHLDPEHHSNLSKILAKVTPMPVVEVGQNTPVQADHVYVMPENVGMTIVSGQLKLIPRSQMPADGHYPIDAFFVSLALECQERAISVVLSGTGADGAVGSAAVTVEGGMTFAQDTATAKFSGMPSAAIASGVDFILSPEEIANQLNQMAAFFGLHGSINPDHQRSFSDETISLKRIIGLVHSARGMDFANYKRPTIQRRILRRMAARQMGKVDDYITYLRSHPAEVDSLYEDLLLKVTCFFRGSDSFKAMREAIFPAIFAKKSPLETVRIWVPGCSTGEEAFSIAICLLEYMSDAGHHHKVELFATDISDKALHTARTGFYDASISEHVTQERLERFFLAENDGYRVHPMLRDCCIFAKQNVTRDPPFSKLDFISCRNLLIYLLPWIQSRVLATFHFALNATGYLCLGNAETIGAASDLFTIVDKANRIFRRTETPPGFRVTQFDTVLAASSALVQSESHPVPATAAKGRQNLKQLVERAIISQYVPPAVVINDRLDVLQVLGDTSAFLMVPPGELTSSLLKMCKPGLLVDLRIAIHEAQATGVKVKKDAWVKTSHHDLVAVDIDVLPFSDGLSREPYFIVLFGPRTAPTQQPAALVSGAQDEIHRLERELLGTKDYLNAIIEKEQASNEALKSASEEILSANEELQSTNEEMATAKEETQAANEELTTVNDELQNRNLEMTRINSDLANLLGSVQIPIVMLSEQLAVRRYTPAAEKVLNLTQADIGRSLAEIGPRLHISGLEALATDVLESLNTKDQEVRDDCGRWYSIRIKPYRTVDNKIDGAVIALVEIDSLKRSVERLKEAQHYAEAIVQTAPIPLLILDEELTVRTANQAFYSHFNVNPTAAKNIRIYDLGNGEWNLPEFRALLEQILSSQDVIENFVVDHDFAGIGRRTMRMIAKRLVQESDKAGRIILAIHDLTEEKKNEEKIRAAKEAAEIANQSKSEFLANMSHEIRTPLAAILGYAELFANPLQTRDEALQCTTRIRKNVEQLTELIDEILDIAKVEAGKLEIEKVSFSLLPELAETFAMLESRAKAKGLALEVEFVGEIPQSLTSCPKRFRQVLNNIVGNAVKFTEQGGVAIVISLTGRGAERRLTFAVSDSGCGLTPEQQQRIFQPFVQADSSVTRRFGGTGLGLVLARRLAQALGGDIVLTASEGDKGSTFTISIHPGDLSGAKMLRGLTKAALERGEEKISNWFTSSERLASLRVLLVEDGADIRELMAHFLTSSGARVETAANGSEALAKVDQSAPFDVVLMDIQMPVMDGFQATKQLLARGFQAPILALTAHAMHGERERCLAAGFSDYVTKPVNPTLLIETVLAAVKKKVQFLADGISRSLMADDPAIGPLVQGFVANLPQRVAAIRLAQTRADWAEIANLAHQMAGAAGSFGFPDIGTVAAGIERHIRTGDSVDGIEPKLSQFASLCRQATQGHTAH